MSPLCLPTPTQEKLESTSTTAGSAMKTSTSSSFQAVSFAPFYSGTASSESVLDWCLYVMEKQTASCIVITISLPSLTETSQATINELKQLSGLTWEQLAKIFNVSRRSLHFWASGKPLSPFNEEHLRRLLGTLRYVNRGSSDINRSALLQPQKGSVIPLDLLIAGKYEEVKRLLGAGKAVEKPKLKPLSPEAITSRLPLLPEDLVGALQDTIHREVGRSRPAKTTRSRKRSGDQ
jgi:DNA-binding transcriptional regulator YiaG